MNDKEHESHSWASKAYNRFEQAKFMLLWMWQDDIQVNVTLVEKVTL